MAKEIRCDYVQFFFEIQKIGSDGILCVAKIWRKILEMATSNINFNNIPDKFKFALQFFGLQLFLIYWNLCVKMPTLCMSKKKKLSVNCKFMFLLNTRTLLYNI